MGSSTAAQAPTEQQQLFQEPTKMATEKVIVKVSNKPDAPADWSNTLKAIWANDSQRPSIYATDQAVYWQGRTSVQERSR